MKIVRRALLVAASLVLLVPAGADATHSWGGYHWARTANPFTVTLLDGVSSRWDSYLATASSDWSASSVLNTVVAPSTASPKTCKAVNGKVLVCSASYGNRGWLGVAQIYVSGLHITKGTVKVNDTYFNTATYNTPAWRALVMCQEIGHTFGLDHQDETFDNQNLGTCMDYTNDPDGTLYNQLSNEHPNQHDYDELVTIYSHLDSTTTVISSSVSSGSGRGMRTWGTAIRTSGAGRPTEFVRHLSGNRSVYTFVIWAR
jgi:hypothetical protein